MSRPANPGMSVIVKTVARSVARLMLLFGFYITMHSHITHGDGFAGGVIMTLAFILIMVAFGRETALRVLPKSAARVLAGLGALLLTGAAAMGLIRGFFFFNFLGVGRPFQFWSAGLIPLYNIAIGLVVTGSLIGIFAALIMFNVHPEKEAPMIYLLCLAVFCIGLYGVVRKRNVIKIIIGLILCEYAANLLFVMVGYRMNGRAPVLAPNMPIENMVDPLPQAMVMTTIVIGMATTLLLVALAIRLYEKYGTFDITQIKDLQG